MLSLAGRVLGSRRGSVVVLVIVVAVAVWQLIGGLKFRIFSCEVAKCKFCASLRDDHLSRFNFLFHSRLPYPAYGYLVVLGVCDCV